MAIMDKLAEFCDATSVAAAAGTAVIGNQIDLSAAGIDIGRGTPPVYLVITCATSIITGGAAGTAQFELVSDSVATLDSSVTQHWIGDAFVTDGTDANEISAGDVIAIVPLPAENETQTYERYLGLRCITATTTTTAGAVDAYLTLTPPHLGKDYDDGSN